VRIERKGVLIRDERLVQVTHALQRHCEDVKGLCIGFIRVGGVESQLSRLCDLTLSPSLGGATDKRV